MLRTATLLIESIEVLPTPAGSGAVGVTVALADGSAMRLALTRESAIQLGTGLAVLLSGEIQDGPAKEIVETLTQSLLLMGVVFSAQPGPGKKGNQRAAKWLSERLNRKG